MKFISLVAAISASLLCACATNPSSAVPTVSSVRVDLLSASASAGMATTVTAEATLSDGSTSDVTTQAAWTSSDNTVALLACTQTPCQVTAVAAGTATLTANYGGKTGSAIFTVSAATLTSVAVVASALSVPVGELVNCSALGTFSDGSQQDVSSMATWSSSSATTASVSTAGVVTGVAAGMATITAAVEDLMSAATVTVTAAAPIAMTISPDPANVALGTTLQMAATATLSDGTTMDATTTAQWTSSNTVVAIVSTGGEVLPQATGTATITASFGSLTASETVTVTAAQVTSIAITPDPASIPAGLSVQLSATATLTDLTMKDVTSSVTWTSSDSTFATISASGLATGAAAGSVTITATLGTVIATDTLTIGAATPVSLVITVPDMNIALGSTEQLTATATFSDGSMGNVTSSAVWTGAPAGEFTGQTEGTASVTATDGLATETVMIDVGPAVPNSVTVSAPQSSIPAGLTVAFDALSEFTNGNMVDVTSSSVWSCSDTAGTIATVNAATGVVTTVGTGTATITATIEGKSGSFQFTVDAGITSIAVSPASATIPIGQTRQLAVSATLSDTTLLDVTSLAAWSTSDAAGDIATVSTSGLVTGVATSATMVTVTATVGSNMSSAQITID